MPAYRAAPIQISFKGFMGTLGHPMMDYVVVDRTAVPPDRAHSLDEKLIVMPHTLYVCDLKQVPNAGWPPHDSLRANRVMGAGCGGVNGLPAVG